MEIVDIYERLHKCPSPSGSEQSAQSVVRDLVIPFVDDVSCDVHGNLISVKRAKHNEKAKTLMLVAHVDEVGLMVSHIEDSGFIRFSKIGGVDTSILRGRDVQILHEGESIPGVIGCRPIHMKDHGEKDLDISDLWIDIGATSFSEAQNIISIGDSIVLSSCYHHLKNSFISGRGCDDKVGISILIKVLESLEKTELDVNVVFVSSVQEEVGLRGASTSAYNVNPDICIAVDVAHATDYPGIKKAKYGNIQLGSGPVISYGSDLTASIQKTLVNLAQEHSIPYQVLAQPGSSGTDVHAVQVSRGGCASGLISIPCRYMHTPTEVVSINDMYETVKVISMFCQKVTDLYE